MTPVSTTPGGYEDGELTLVQDNAAAIAGRFLGARRSASGLADYPGDFPLTLDQAYAIQDAAIARQGMDVLGWKVGRILPPLSDRFDADRLVGPIFHIDETGSGAGPAMPVFAEGFAAAEAEFALRVGRTPPAGKTSFTLEESADLIDAVHVGIEIASSPLGTINALGPIAVISDFGNNNGLVIGPAVPEWRSSGFEDWLVSTLIDDRVVGTGRAAAFPDGAIGAARFLFQLMARRNIALQPGQWISSGAVSGVHEAEVGQRVEVVFNGAFQIGCSLVAARPE